jgi:hypothetical protein
MLCRVTSAAVMRKPRNQPVRIMRYAALGGFGGVYVALHLGKMLSPAELEGTEIALVNRDNYIVF